MNNESKLSQEVEVNISPSSMRPEDLQFESFLPGMLQIGSVNFMTDIEVEEFDRLAEEGADLSEYFEGCTPVWCEQGTATFSVTVSEDLKDCLEDEAFRRNLNLADTVADILGEWQSSHKSNQSSDGPAAA